MTDQVHKSSSQQVATGEIVKNSSSQVESVDRNRYSSHARDAVVVQVGLR